MLGNVALGMKNGVYMSRTFYGSLLDEVGETELQELFGRTRPSESVAVMRQQAMGRARGVAFVKMSSDAEVHTASRRVQASQIGGRSLTVDEARPKPSRGGDFGGAHSPRRRSEPCWYACE